MIQFDKVWLFIYTSTIMKFSYNKIADAIYKDFIKDILQEDQALPTEQELASYYQISRTTVRRAIKELIKSNNVYSVQGSGTYVKKNYVVEHNIPILDTFIDYAHKVGKKPTTKVLEFSTIEASLEIAHLLKVEVDTMLYYIRRLRFLDDVAYNYEISYMPVHLFPALSIAIMEKSKYDYIEKELGLLIIGNHAMFTPTILTDEINSFYKCQPKSLALCVKMQSYLKGGECFEYTESIRNPDYYIATIDINRVKS